MWRRVWCSRECRESGDLGAGTVSRSWPKQFSTNHSTTLSFEFLVGPISSLRTLPVFTMEWAFIPYGFYCLPLVMVIFLKIISPLSMHFSPAPNVWKWSSSLASPAVTEAFGPPRSLWVLRIQWVHELKCMMGLLSVLRARVCWKEQGAILKALDDGAWPALHLPGCPAQSFPGPLPVACVMPRDTPGELWGA